MATVKDKYLDNAQKLIAKGQFDKAAKEYRALLQLDPDIRHRQRLAELLVKSGERDEAVEEYKGIARYYADNHFLLKAIAVLKQVQKLVPDDVNVTLTLADINQRQGLTGNCLTEYQAALSYYEKRHNIIDAVDVLKRMLAVDPENLKIHITLAERRFSIGQQEEAFEDFRQVAERVRQQGDESLHRQITGRIATLFPGRSQADPLTDLARRLKGGDAAGVIPALLALAETAPSREIADLLLEASRKAGDAHAFRSACLLAIRQSPDDPGPRRGLLSLAMQEQGGEGAVALLESWSEELRSASRLPLLYALCREAAAGVKGNSPLLERLAVMDPSLVPHQPPPPPKPAPISAPPTDQVETKAAAPATPAVPPAPDADSHHWEEDLDLAIANAEDFLADHEELVELDPLDLEPELSDEADVPEIGADEGLVPVTLTPADLSRQNWSLSGGDVSVTLDELALEEEVEELGAQEPDVEAIVWPDEAAGTGELLSSAELVDFGDDFIAGLLEPGDDEPSGAHGFAGLFNETRRSVDSSVDADDTESHFNLGIAYKEMGLLDDAIVSFAAAAVNPARRIDSIVLQGLCHRERGDLVAAERVLRQGIAESAPDSEGVSALLYELALLLEAKGDRSEALGLYERVHRFDSFFRDVSERIAQLGGVAETLDLADAELVEE